MGKTLLTPRHSLNAFFRSPSRLDVRMYLNYCHAVEHKSLFITFWFVGSSRKSIIFYGARALLSSCPQLCFRCILVCPQAPQHFIANYHIDGGRKPSCKVSVLAMTDVTYL